MLSLRATLGGLGIVLCSCAHLGPAPRGPEGTTRAYADALEQGRLDEAFSFTEGEGRELFGRRYADPHSRAQRVAQLRAAADGAGAEGPVALALEHGAWKVLEPLPASATVQSQAQAALTAFLDAAEAGHFERALGLLSARWRGRYTAQRFKDDFGREPLARERLQRARAALAGVWAITADGAELAVGAGKVVSMARESEGFRVVSLE